MRPADVAHADQVEAADAATERALMRHLWTLPGDVLQIDTRPAPWFVAAVERHNAAIEAGRGRACEHVTPAPGLRVIALWPGRAGWTFCGRCAAMPGALLDGGDSREDRTCDSCRKYFPAGVFLGTTRIGSTLAYFATCGPCRAAMVAGGRGGGDGP